MAIITVLALLIGFIVGYFAKGISITITKPEEEIAEQDYNQSTVDLLDPQIREYLENTQGNINF